MSIKFRWHKIILAIFLIAMLFSVAACNSDNDSLFGGGSDFEGGGIGGTGVSTGVITGFGSVFVNGHEYDISEALKTVDGVLATEDNFEIGMKVRIEVEDGAVISIEYEPELKGLVADIDLANNTFTIFGRTVILSSSTVLNILDTLAALKDGDIVEAGGFFDSAGNLVATFIELEDPEQQEFKIKGSISNHDPDARRFQIADLTVDYNALQNPPALANDLFVEVEGSFDKPENILFAEAIEIEDPAALADADDEMEIEGIITGIDSSTPVEEFSVNGLPVQITDSTEFEKGNRDDIVVDARVEVEGTVTSGILIAEKIEFHNLGLNKGSEVKIEAATDKVDIENSTVEVMGITVEVKPGTLIKDDREDERPFGIEDIEEGDFLEIKGFLDDDNKIVAIKLEREDDKDEVLLKGIVDAKNKAAMSIRILDKTVDLSGAEFEDGNEQHITADVFFGAITEGVTTVEVKGTLDTNGDILADKSELDDRNDDNDDR